MGEGRVTGLHRKGDRPPNTFLQCRAGVADREVQVIPWKSPAKIRSPNSNGATAPGLSSFPRDFIHLIYGRRSVVRQILVTQIDLTYPPPESLALTRYLGR